MSKELNILQAIEMPVGTEFEILNPNCNDYNSEYSKTVIISENEANAKVLLGDGKYEMVFNDYVASLKLKVIQKPVSFMEAVKSGKKIKVDISNLKLHREDIKCVLEKLNRFQYITYIIEIFNDYLGNEDIRNIILNGTWYIEED